MNVESQHLLLHRGEIHGSAVSQEGFSKFGITALLRQGELNSNKISHILQHGCVFCIYFIFLKITFQNVFKRSNFFCLSFVKQKSLAITSQREKEKNVMRNIFRTQNNKTLNKHTMLHSQCFPCVTQQFLCLKQERTGSSHKIFLPHIQSYLILHQNRFSRNGALPVPICAFCLVLPHYSFVVIFI